MTRDEVKRLRRTWRGGLPGFGATPPVAPVPAPRAPAEADERLLDTVELAAIWDGWKATP